MGIDTLSIGRILRPFGTRGEVLAEVSNDYISELDPAFVFLVLDGIPVPFRLDDWREKTDTSYLLHFADINTEEQTRRLIGAEIALERSLLPDDAGEGTDSLIGFELLAAGKSLGRIVDIDTTTANTLLLLENDLVIPFHEDFLVALDEENRRIILNLPDGLID